MTIAHDLRGSARSPDLARARLVISTYTIPTAASQLVHALISLFGRRYSLSYTSPRVVSDTLAESTISQMPRWSSGPSLMQKRYSGSKQDFPYNASALAMESPTRRPRAVLGPGPTRCTCESRRSPGEPFMDSWRDRLL